MLIEKNSPLAEYQEEKTRDIFPGHENLRVACAHYWLVTWRGGEKVVKAILDLFPKSDIYTLFYDEAVCGQYLENYRVVSSKIDIKLLRRHYQKLFPLYPLGVKSLKLDSGYDMLISSESGPIKGINKGTLPHLCYIHTPMRYCWDHASFYVETLPAILKPIAAAEFRRLKHYDITTINNVDAYVANSENVRNRVKKYYNRDASVVYPPIADMLFTKAVVPEISQEKKQYYLSFGAITPYKKIDLLIDTFNRNGDRLEVIGDGSERKKLEHKAGKNIRFWGVLPWEKIQELAMGAKALIFPGEEDFGMIPLELMALGVPVLAFKKGGALETVVENVEDVETSTGLFFSEQTPESLQTCIDTFEKHKNSFNPQNIYSHAAKFCETNFKKQILKEIKTVLQ